MTEILDEVKDSKHFCRWVRCCGHNKHTCEWKTSSSNQIESYLLDRSKKPSVPGEDDSKHQCRWVWCCDYDCKWKSSPLENLLDKSEKIPSSGKENFLNGIS